MATALSLPDTAYRGEATHITDHNLIVAACAALDARTTNLAALSGGLSVTGNLGVGKNPTVPLDVVGVMKSSTEIQGTGLRVGPNAGAPAYNFASGNGNLDEYGPFDLFWDAYNRKLHTRSLLVEDVGDPPDLVLRRGGESAVGYPDNPAAKGQIGNGTSMGSIYWEAWGNTGYNAASAAIFVRAVGAQTDAGNNGGEMWFCTRVQNSWGNALATPKMVLRDSGQLELVSGRFLAAASTTGYASLNLPVGVAPTSPVDGDVWQDGTHVYCRINGVTKQLDNA